MEAISFVSIGQLGQLRKRLRQISGDRAQELNLLQDEFGDLDDLVRFCVEPHLQDRNPAARRTGIAAPVPRQPAFSLLNRFLDGCRPGSQDGSHQLFLLGDAGMGKTSLLLLLKLMHLAGFWPSGYHCELFRLGRDALAQLAAVDRKSETVLLLDGLNEDRLAHNRMQARLHELLQASREFRRVIISCRSLLFPEVKVDSAGQFIIKGLAGYSSPILYLSPFSSRQVQEVIRRRLTPNSGQYFCLQGFGAGRLRTNASHLIDQIQDVRIRPLLLRHIGALMKLDLSLGRNLAALYEALIRHWLDSLLRLLKTQRKNCCAPLPEAEAMFNGCLRLAKWMEEHDREEATETELRDLLCEEAVLFWLEHAEPEQFPLLRRTSEHLFRFSHVSFREFLLAHAVVSSPQPLPFPVRATDQLLRFVELAGGTAEHISRLDFAGFNPLRHAEFHGSFFPWQERFLSRRGRVRTGPELIMLPGGRFRMGDIRGKGADNARPVHEVELDSFALGRCPVTFAEYDVFCAATGRKKPKDSGWGRGRRPVIDVSWHDAADYCAWLSEATGQHYRLPTEAEWEYACRAGSEAAYCFGDDEDALDAYSWHVSNAGGKTHPVGTKRANAWGFCDMHGNVWEWCADWYSPDYHPGFPVRNPLGTEPGAGRVLRGGSWDSSGRFVSACFRFCLSPGLRISRAGFRVAMGHDDS